MKRSKERVVLKDTEFEGTPRNETVPCPNLPFELSRAHQPHCREAHVRSQTSRSRSVHTSKGTKRIFDAKGFGKSFLFFESFRNEVKVLVNNASVSYCLVTSINLENILRNKQWSWFTEQSVNLVEK